MRIHSTNLGFADALLRLAVGMFISACPASGGSAAVTPAEISMYAGTFSNTSLQSILFAGETDYKESYITVLSMTWPIAEPRMRGLTLSGEGQFAKHFGLMRHVEINGVLVVRTDAGYPFSVALGEGLSYASRNPDLENPKGDIFGWSYRERSRGFLNYMMLEAAVEARVLPGWLNPFPTGSDLFLRIHHRSGAFGMYCPPTCGSNFVTYGMRFRI